MSGVLADGRCGGLGPIPTLSKPDPAKEEATAYLQKNQVVLNWYPKIQAMKSGGVASGDVEAAPNQAHLNTRHIAFLDLGRLYFELERFKAERGWYNLNLSADGIADLLADQSWYQLLIPAEELLCDSFEKVRLWEEIALSLLKKFTERYYTFRKREWELPHLEFQELTENDPNFPKGRDEDGEGYYRILLDRSQEEIVTKLAELKDLIEKGDLKPWEFSGMKAIWFGRHLYEPLLYLDQNIVEVSPVPLNKGERNLVEDVKLFHDETPAFFADKELYLLRNLSKGRGVGFFEAGNFHPDFILWLISGGQQFIAFVDPKGIRNIGFNDPKIQFSQTIKDIERRLSQATGEVRLADRVREELGRLFPGRDESQLEVEVANELKRTVKGYRKCANLDDWLANAFFEYHASLYKSRPIFWHIASSQGTASFAFGALVHYHRFDKNRMAKLRASYVRDTIEELRRDAGLADKAGRADDRVELQAKVEEAQALDKKLQQIQEGHHEGPEGGDRDFRILTPWKESGARPRGWNPDLDDGVKVNIAPLDRAGVLRSTGVAR